MYIRIPMQWYTPCRQAVPATRCPGTTERDGTAASPSAPAAQSGRRRPRSMNHVVSGCDGLRERDFMRDFSINIINTKEI
ncbi:hypothetical protein DPMN_143532 [Dreissena polymorpha]|uniref:Uncharacterized protein n=1 Tax=Dreissena polymorpha TaxID=45954 RepID=A0A9D4JNA8_DREPO|nr:hypothetical protein DPMN_143532 [Dreissena polymorpha]